MWVHRVGLDLSPLTPHPHPSPSPLTFHLSPLTSHTHLSGLTRHLSLSPLTLHLLPLTSHPSPFTSHPSLHPMRSRMASLLVCNLPSSHLPHSLYTCSSSALRIYVASFPLFRFLLRCHLSEGKPPLIPFTLSTYWPGLSSQHSSITTEHMLVQVSLNRPGIS